MDGIVTGIAENAPSSQRSEKTPRPGSFKTRRIRTHYARSMPMRGQYHRSDTALVICRLMSAAHVWKEIVLDWHSHPSNPGRGLITRLGVSDSTRRGLSSLSICHANGANSLCGIDPHRFSACNELHARTRQSGSAGTKRTQKGSPPRARPLTRRDIYARPKQLSIRHPDAAENRNQSSS